MNRRTHLFLALSRGGWGEASFGLYLADQLRALGDEVVFLTHVSNMPLFAEKSIEVHEVGDHIGSLALTLIKECAKERDVASIVLCDYLTTDGALRRFGVDSKELINLAIPIIAVDTWQHAYRNDSIDIFSNKKIVARDWIESLHRLRPCPILRPDDQIGTCSYLPQPVKIANSVRRHVRAGFGLQDEDVAVLFCTAKWQQSAYEDEDGDRCAYAFPQLLSQYLSDSDQRIHLIHVGPSSLSVMKELGNRYHWTPPLGPKFDFVLGAVDMLLSANISATTVSRAIFSKTPVLVLQNSYDAKSLESASSQLGGKLTLRVEDWMSKALPIFKFSLWPIGFHKFTTPLLTHNPYMRALRSVEWLEEQAVIESMHDLLFSTSARIAQQESQEEYIDLVKRLPTPGESFHNILRMC